MTHKYRAESNSKNGTVSSLIAYLTPLCEVQGGREGMQAEIM
jgi:hypothetical protein